MPGRVFRVLWLYSAVLACFSSAAETDPALQRRLTRLLTLPMTAVVDREYACTPSASGHKLNDFHMRGTALGGWLVLEPWITPSLFYQFLGASEKWGDEAYKHVGLDSRTFCTALGDKEANRQLRNHWKTWVTEEQIRKLATSGVKYLRLPVADWMYLPYEPYIGCWDGALEEVDRGLHLCQKYNIKVIMDLHAVRGSQNGLDNSGDTGHYTWVENLSSSGAAVYEHWLQRGGDWAGSYNHTSQEYESIDSENMLSSLHVINAIVDRYKDHPAVVGVEPVNEPWDKIPMSVLKEFYWRSYQIVQMKAPHWVTLLHDSFRLTPEEFGSFMRHCDNYAIDTHIYQAWAWENPARWFQVHACEDRTRLREMEALGVPVIVGEWSLATDNCAMWLNGFNDNVPGYPKVQCDRVQCPEPYMGLGVQPGAPPDPTMPAQEPFGAGGPSYVEYGTCPRDRPFPNDLEEVRLLSLAKLHAFDYGTHGQFFWNFRTEFEPRWDYLQAVELGWIPRVWDSEEVQHAIATGCDAFLPQNVTDAGSNSTASDGDGVWSASTAGTPRVDKSLHALSTLLIVVSVVVAMVYYLEGKGWMDSGFIWDRRRQQYTPVADRDPTVTTV